MEKKQNSQGQRWSIRTNWGKEAIKVLKQNSMLEQKKGNPSRLYILEDDEPKLEALCKSSRLSKTAALTMIVSAGLEALKENHNRITLPLEFQVSEPCKR